MKGRVALSVPPEEALRLCQIRLDRDRDEALVFLAEHARKPLHEYLEGGCEWSRD
jgi:hypothetical protein